CRDRTGPASGPRWPRPARPTSAWPSSATSPACSGTGRPATGATARARAARVVRAFVPGEGGGPVIAGVLSARIQPSGKLPVQIPKRPGGQPRTYLQPPLGGPESPGISTPAATPLDPFGH